MNRTDFIDADSGVLSTLEGQVPLAMFQREPEGEGASLELSVRPDRPTVTLAHPAVGHWEITAARMDGKLVTPSGESSTSGFGATTHGSLSESGDPEGGADPAVLRRLIAIAFEDGGLFALAAACGSEAESHAAETVIAGSFELNDGACHFETPLLSTEYDSDGMQRRATLELRTQQGAIARGGGTALAGVEIELPGARSTIAFFEWSMEGRTGIGRYEIIRAA